MPKTFMFLIIGLFFGTGFGFLIAATTGTQLDGHDHSAHDHGDGHDTLTEAGTPAPTLTLTLHPDGAQSRNLHIGVTNFAFTPEAVNTPHVPGEGHAHVYLDGVKLTRAYAPWVHLSDLPKGTHTIRVTLNANDHPPLASNGIPLAASLEVTIE